MADEPIWSCSNGSSNSLRLCSSRQSVAALWALCAMPESVASDLRVDFARIRLPGDGIAGGEAHLGGHALVEPLDLVVVAGEELQEAGLRAGRAFHAAGLERGKPVLDLVQVLHQVICPQAGPLAHRRRLGRLKVREAQAGQVAVPRGERGQSIDCRHEPRTQAVPATRAAESGRCCR